MTLIAGYAVTVAATLDGDASVAETWRAMIAGPLRGLLDA